MRASANKENDFLHYIIGFIAEKLRGWMDDIMGPLATAIKAAAAFVSGAMDTLNSLNKEIGVVKDAMAVVGGFFGFGGGGSDDSAPEEDASSDPAEEETAPDAPYTEDDLSAKEPTAEGGPPAPPSEDQVEQAKKVEEAKKILEESRPPEVIEKDIVDTEQGKEEKERELTPLEKKLQKIKELYEQAQNDPESLLSIEAKFQGLVNTAKGGEVEMEITAIIMDKKDDPIHGKVAFSFGNPAEGALSFFTNSAPQMQGMISSELGL